MDFTLDQNQREMQAQIIDFCRKRLNEGVGERYRDQTFPKDLWLECGEMGLPGLPVPEEHGGVGLDSLSTALMLEAFGYGCKDGGLVFAVCAHLLACVIPVWKHGSDELKARYLKDLCSGKKIAVNGMSEPDSGSDAFAMTTKAVPDGDGFRITGNKTFSSNGPVADVAIVYAVTDPGKGYHGGVSAFLVESGEGGFQVGQKFEKMGLRTASISELVLDDVYVPADAMVGHRGAGGAIFNQSMEWERVCLVAAHLGTMRRLLETSIEYSRTRKAYGQQIAKFQAVSHRIVDMKTRLEASRWLTYHAASRLDVARDIGMDASLTKLFVSESLVQTAIDAVRTLGGYGYMEEYEVERALRDAMGGVLYSGTSDIQRNIVASWLGL
jgi:alkylation response protein AidB-like acyl-CoA dehydrogenase